MKEMIRPIEWKEGKLYILNQLKLPMETEYNIKATVEDVFNAIRDMELRGAPLIGIAAAYGVYLSVKDESFVSHEDFMKFVDEKALYLSQSRPTAVNLFWALDRMKKRAKELENLLIEDKKKALLEEAIKIHKEDEAINRSIGENFLKILKDGMTIMTHCNAGSLATSRYGTATSPMYLAREKGWSFKVFANETRPYLQGARLTAFELHHGGIDVTLICDNMAGSLMAQGKVDAIITGADRVAANGDTANKIGTLQLAVMAKHYGVPFYVAVPTPTIDLSTPTGIEIPIEERGSHEVTNWFGKATAPEGIKVYNPAFDVTAHSLITAIVTEKGIVYPPYNENLKKLFLNI
ncbi:S-methyl-5-thioribose-1-phosphate isomerase [Alkaliphilus peptidifermentans]|uniref:Methylthioribose-1-phosphate isomerase n=1 Tax=Alkaliphilus peptidifermentans DSM 18978 TaxID=1120976 RepID=A0A1G5ISF2_9FIRM|nr:S-methyl-5-thioribose-1-phosphate isomerase [Alkaliphilus peptidifermentans]SCY78549.1 methylthioribose-1-phosphate isomerase [Alkaliphilus peptidifermentans DSM 18978]